MKKDYIIDAAIWHIEIDPLPERMLKRIQESYLPLISFFQVNNLLRDKQFGMSVSDWRKFTLRVSDFTEEGAELTKRCHHKWLSALDRGKDPMDIKLWGKELLKLRESKIDTTKLKGS